MIKKKGCIFMILVQKSVFKDQNIKLKLRVLEKQNFVHECMYLFYFLKHKYNMHES